MSTRPAPRPRSSSRPTSRDTTMARGRATRSALRHNFRASRIYTEAQLSDPAFHRRQWRERLGDGVRGDQSARARHAAGGPGARRSAPRSAPTTTGRSSTPIGPWIQRLKSASCRPSPRAAPSRCSPTEHDEDTFLGIDPESLQFDLGDDVLAFARKRLAIARDLLKHQETRALKPEQNYAVLRRSVVYALREHAACRRCPDAPDRRRAHAARPRWQRPRPAPAGARRAAARGARPARHRLPLGRQPDLSAELQRTSWRSTSRNAARPSSVANHPASTDFSPALQVVEVQRGLLAALMSDAVAGRLLDSESKLPSEALRLSELYQRIDAAVWSELGGKGDITSVRRELQRDHVSRLGARAAAPGPTPAVPMRAACCATRSWRCRRASTPRHAGRA